MGTLPLEGELPELAGVAWRTRVDEAALARRDRGWTRSTLTHVLPWLAVAVGLPWLSLVMLPVSVFALGFAWLVPRLYAARGAGALREPRVRRGASVPRIGAEDRALGLLGDLVGHAAREGVRSTGFLVEPGRLGVWVLGPAGALLVRPGGRRVSCWCVRATGEGLPRADRIAHLLLALRADEAGFATVANLTFSGARWRVARVLPGVDEAARERARAALTLAVERARLAAAG